MTKKLQGNGLWESSRMMLPEHKEAILRSNQQLKSKLRPVLDEQETEGIVRNLSESLRHGREVSLTVYGEFSDERMTGVVKAFDPAIRRICLQGPAEPAGKVWICLEDIMSAE